MHETPSARNTPFDNEVDWDEEHSLPEPNGTSAPSTSLDPFNPILIERQTIALPSNGNVDVIFAHAELSRRQRQAKTELDCIRELISEKSFQYSHVIRDAPRKSVKTRAQAKIKGLNGQLMFHCRLYSRCRKRLEVLGADMEILETFRTLTKDDVKASTAVLNPNIPGSTTFRLSWIWQASHLARHGPDSEDDTEASTLLECLFYSI